MAKKTATKQVTQDVLKDLQIWGEKYGRKFLRPIKKFAPFPDLLGAQKKGFREFVEYYLNKLFEEINPIQEIAGERLKLSIFDLEVSLPEISEEMCKRKEKTYG
jgi:DNA-directed RNA polymerase beta subunit